MADIRDDRFPFSYVGIIGFLGGRGQRLIAGDWILTTGFWNDGGSWIDTDFWID